MLVARNTGAGMSYACSVSTMASLAKPEPVPMLDPFANFILCRQKNRLKSASLVAVFRVPKGVLAVLAMVLLLGACAGAPTRHLQSVAVRQGLEESVEQSKRFSHRVFRNAQRLQRDTLNVYLEGDGMPWALRYFVVSDPTPRWPMMLHLMARDESAAVYIGRPCYNGFAKEAGCDASLWTSARYSRTVVNSMVDIVAAELALTGASRVNLFGHSGGGALALLMAEKLPQTDTIVTIAGNIDIDAWTRLHGYSPLFGSLNPRARPALDDAITQVHLLGEGDRNIPPSLALEWIGRQPNSYGVVYAGFNHSCCWSKDWARIVRQVSRGDNPLQFRYKPFKLPERRFLFAESLR